MGIKVKMTITVEIGDKILELTKGEAETLLETLQVLLLKQSATTNPFIQYRNSALVPYKVSDSAKGL